MVDAPDKRADALHDEADLLLECSGLARVLQGYGQVHVTGSYALGLMAWRTLDIHLVLFEMWDPLDAFFALGHQIAKLRGVTRMSFGNHLRQPETRLPLGLYWGIRMFNLETDAEWSIDLWAVDEAHVHQTDGLMQRIRQALDDTSRRIILDMKPALFAHDEHPPFLSSISLYEAVLFEGLRDQAAILEYLRNHSVEGL